MRPFQMRRWNVIGPNMPCDVAPPANVSSAFANDALPHAPGAVIVLVHDVPPVWSCELPTVTTATPYVAAARCMPAPRHACEGCPGPSLTNEPDAPCVQPLGSSVKPR